jgi:hypothetical protein
VQRPLDEAHIREVANAIARDQTNGGACASTFLNRAAHAKLMGLLLLSMAGPGGLVLRSAARSCSTCYGAVADRPGGSAR